MNELWICLFIMNYCLLVLISIAIGLNLIEYICGKFKKYIVIINILFHLCSFAIIAICGLELTELFVFFLCSTVVSHILLLKEV